MLKTRLKTGSASIWLDYNGKPIRIGYALHAGGVLRQVRWEAPWRDQTRAWKTQQRNHIAALIAAWHAESAQPPRPAVLPPSVVGTFDLDGFRFAVEGASAQEHSVLSVVNAQGCLTPIADLLHDNGRVCAMVTRPGWSRACLGFPGESVSESICSLAVHIYGSQASPSPRKAFPIPVLYREGRQRSERANGPDNGRLGFPNTP
ncbi:hypothetical protein [Glycomyces sp. NRRL B-16210]|uniref:hypothetical protein n=1 Tax=Glycomyces sp. NRRL B-16210 TaxID=1463821 RepID=UPI001060137F|nr:hypothetical protein [Glycomyces sp. NRRL B-16210]